jgi:hypothetical protein
VPLGPTSRPTVPLGTVTTRVSPATRGAAADTGRTGGRYVTVGGQQMWVEDAPAAPAAPTDLSPQPRDPLAPGGVTVTGSGTGTGTRTGAGTVGVDAGTRTEPADNMITRRSGSATAGRGAGSSSGGFTFNDLPEPENVRVIHIPLKRLRNGELKYNVVIRPKDVIIAQNLQVGVYYMGGHVARGGAFSLTGQKVTLQEAVIAAGMFDALAIPARTDIIRKIRSGTRDGGDRLVYVRVDLDRIFTGQAPDIYLKPDDRVMVGTNALAPFIAAVRGAFRLTYGFGFLYDRNFAVDEERQTF